MEGVCPVNRDVTFLIVLIKFITIMTSSCIGVIKRESFFLFMDTQYREDNSSLAGGN